MPCISHQFSVQSQSVSILSFSSSNVVCGAIFFGSKHISFLPQCRLILGTSISTYIILNIYPVRKIVFINYNFGQRLCSLFNEYGCVKCFLYIIAWSIVPCISVSGWHNNLQNATQLRPLIFVILAILGFYIKYLRKQSNITHSSPSTKAE